MKRNLILVIIFIIATPFAKAQQSRPQTFPVKYHEMGTYKNITVGETVPDFEIPKLIKSDKRTARLSDFKDQLLIVDFWSINCKGCIEGLPRMDSLQKQFGNKIKILPVTWEEEPTVLAWWKVNPYAKKLTRLSSVVEDKNFSSRFHHKELSHEVWIYKGKVIAITSAQYVDAGNIQKVLNGEVISWPVKDDFYVFDGTKEPLFKPDPNQADPASILNYTAISDYKEGVNGTGFTGGMGIVRDPVNKTVRTFFLNQPIYNSYGMNFVMSGIYSSLNKPSTVGVGPNELVWEVSDKNRYTYFSKAISGYDQDWIRKNGICFESLKKDTGQSDQQLYKEVNDDLDRLLGLNVRWEKRKEKVWVLVRTSSADQLPDVNSIPESGKISTGNLVAELNSIESNPYVFNEAKFGKIAYVNVKAADRKDIAAVRRAIQAYGLDLKEEEREVDKLIFSEVNGGLLLKDAVKTK